MMCGRMVSATGIRGIIDVIAPDNPYGAYEVLADLQDKVRHDLRQFSKRIPKK